MEKKKNIMKFVVDVTEINGIAVVNISHKGAAVIYPNNKSVGKDFLAAKIQFDLLTFLRDEIGK